MRYLCLIYEDEKWWEKASEADMQKGMADYNAFTSHPERQTLHHRRTLRRDEGAAGRLLPDQREGLERRGPGGLADSRRAAWHG